MKREDRILKAVEQWLNIAERDLESAKQGIESQHIITESVCFHCQQSAEKFLKAYLVFHQVDFPKTHKMAVIINLCATIDKEFNEKLAEVNLLTDYAAEIRYPDDWYEPSVEETKKAFKIAKDIKEFVLRKISF